MRKIRVLFFLLALSFAVRAQTIKSFTGDSVKFLNELSAFFQETQKKEAKDFIEKDFGKKFWYAGKLTPARRQFVYETANEMLSKRMRPYPDFENFLLSLMNFYSSAQSDASFESWKSAVVKILTKSTTKKFSDFLRCSKNLFASNSLFKSNAADWFSSNNNYSFEFDTVPKVIFPSLDLSCGVKADTLTIYNTQGILYPTEDKFVGKGGKVTWTRNGIDENTVYAELKNYTVNLRQQGYKADSAVFYNKVYFQKPLIGTVTDKAVPDATPANSTNPHFLSYSKRFKINGIAENRADYDGGFTMSGAKFIGSGTRLEPAYLTFKRNNKPFLTASSRQFIFKKDRISAEEASVVMHLDTDSIYHPSVSLKFDIDKKKLNLIRSTEGISRTPYTNSFHRVEMNVEEIEWKLDSAKMDFRTLEGSSQGNAGFTSANFFRRNLYDMIGGVDEINPLLRLKDYSTKINSKLFTDKEFAIYMKYTLESIKPMLVNLASMGFMIYDMEEGYIQVQEKLFDYCKANAKRIDYDVLDISSEVRGGDVNAIFNLLNYDLRIRGVRQIFLSDSQNVYIYPKSGEVVLKRNRNFSFGGNVHAGRFDFYGKEFSFDYDKFKINLPNVDSLRFTVKSFKPDANGDYPEVKCKTVIQDINGDLLVDNPYNKSGNNTKLYPQYPIFNSFKDSYVYYDKRTIQHGVYKKDKFYFHLRPFTIDSLKNFTNAGLNFDGDFVSASIFPQFKENLTLQQDYSLGFHRNTPADGMALYGTKGKFTNEIQLSNEGLKGDGTVDYLTSTTEAHEFVFFPDSMNSMAQKFRLEPVKAGTGKVEYPHATADTIYVHWAPKKDVYQVYNKKKPFVMFDSAATMKGRLDLTPKGLSGKGKIEFAGSELEANLMKFKNRKFDSDTADFRLHTAEKGQFAMSTKNMIAHIDFDDRSGEFKSNGKVSPLIFDQNKYMCFMDRFKWYMDRNSIELSSSIKPKPGQEEGVELTGPEFISIHPKQDSLRFFSPRAMFDLKHYIIYAKEVKFINVADARVYPDSGNVTVEKDAVMRTLNRAMILANVTTKYHNIFNSTVNIFGKKSYAASGDYSYMDEIKNKQTIHFGTITVDTTHQTYGDAVITDSAGFTLSPNFEYKGKVHLGANDKFLTFTGSTRISHKCEYPGRTWFKFSSQIDPNHILIPIGIAPVDDKDNPLAASIMVSNDTSQIYTAFLTRILRKSDAHILQADGYLYFDKPSREYRISNKEKLVEQSLPGNYISLNANNCKVYGEGKMNLGVDLGQVKLQSVGEINYDLAKDSAFFDMLMAVDFFFDNGAMEKMSDGILAVKTLTGVDYGRKLYEKGLREMVGKEKSDKLISQLTLYGSFKKFPEELEHSIFFTDLKFKWVPGLKSYISTGKIGIGSIRKVQVNKLVDGKIQIRKTRSGDEINIYLEADPATWYFFSYTRSYMQVLSSKDDFNNAVKDLKDDKRKQDVEKGQLPFQYGIASPEKKKIVLRNIEKYEKKEGED